MDTATVRQSKFAIDLWAVLGDGGANVVVPHKAKNRTYFQISRASDSKKKLMAEVSEKMSKNHRSLCMLLFRMAAAGMDQETLKEHRAKLLSKDV